MIVNPVERLMLAAGEQDLGAEEIPAQRCHPPQDQHPNAVTESYQEREAGREVMFAGIVVLLIACFVSVTSLMSLINEPI